MYLPLRGISGALVALRGLNKMNLMKSWQTWNWRELAWNRNLELTVRLHISHQPSSSRRTQYWLKRPG
jgi:hypothetical protein